VNKNDMSSRQINHHQFRAHRKSQQTIITDERWYQKGEPFLGKPFTVKKTVERHKKISDILARAARAEARKRNHQLAAAYHQLHNRIKQCRPRRHCGSSACPKCARAFQRAKVAAQEKAILNLASKRSGKHLVMVTIVPTGMTYLPGQFQQIDPLKANRWLKDALARVGVRRVVIGSVDLGWEKRRGQRYLQLHWHFAMWTKKPKVLGRKLKALFPKAYKHEDPVDVTTTTNLDFLPYMNKLIKLPKLLRSGKRRLPELLLLLDTYDSFDFLFMRKLRLSAQSDGIVLRPVKSTRGETRKVNRNEKSSKKTWN
jgi:hypothetical protein